MNAILTRLLKPTHLEYVVIDRDFLIKEVTEGASKFADGEGQIQRGMDVRDYFPELFGLEDILTDILEGVQPNFDLKDIGRFHDSAQPLYFDLYIFNGNEERMNGGGNFLVIACEDATERTVLAQKLGQVANDYALLLTKLNSNKNYLKKILNSLKDALIVTDIEGKIKQHNPACFDLFGYESWELIENPISMLFDNAESANISINIEKFLELEEDIEINCMTKRGEEVCISFSCSLIDASSEPKNFVWIGRDITQRKRYEQALYNLTENLEKIVEERTGQLQQTARKLEAEIAERLQAMEDLQLSEAREREKANQLEAAIAELQRTQAQLVQSEKMVSLGNLVAGVAHEINNPVNFIYGNITHATDYANELIELMKIYQKCYPHPLPAIEEALEEIDAEFLIEDFPKVLFSMKTGAERISEIVKSLRNFSRLDEADLKQVNIHEGIDSTLLILHNRLKAKSRRPDIEVVKNYGAMPPVMCYPGQLNQVFMNVIGNAIDALDEVSSGTKAAEQFEPKIWIETEIMGSQRIGIKIRDNGPGIKPEAVSRLFDPFYTTKPPGKGTGLGLSICYQIVVERHGGSLHCSSCPGAGAEFTIEIPICAQIEPG
ncbi:MAG: hypothetical protein Fur0025_12030 [Oscillatoriaceae cyanobacterium]